MCIRDSVYSHADHPWNQFADRLCAQEGISAMQFTAHVGRVCTAVPGLFSSWLAGNNAAQWALAWSDPMIRASMPNGDHGENYLAFSRTEMTSVDLVDSAKIGAFLDDVPVEGEKMRCDD
eukprot:341096-Karenia_brevis.AAC.1